MNSREEEGTERKGKKTRKKQRRVCVCVRVL